VFDHVAVSENAVHVDDVNKDESTPIVVIIPGLTSDSSSPVSCCYMNHDFIYVCA
jgi:uncharacterized protein (DUF779 family)